MKKAIVTVLAGLLSMSQMAAAAEEKSGLYVGVGLNDMTSSGMEVVQEEVNFLSGGQASRTEKNRRLTKEVILGYQLNPTFAVELGYIGGDSGATSETAGSVKTSDMDNNVINIPVSVTQKGKFSAWHLSLAGQKPLNDYLSVTGRVGVIKTHTEYDKRVAYSWPAAWGGDGSHQGWSHESDKTAALLGLGLSAKVSENFKIRFEVLKSSALSSFMPKADIVYQF